MKTPHIFDLDQQRGRERAVAWALAMTQNTPLAPKHHEQQLLEQFVEGQLSLDEVINQLQGGGGIINSSISR